jgi:hypothetical protein
MSADEESVVTNARDTHGGHICLACSTFIRAVYPARPKPVGLPNVAPIMYNMSSQPYTRTPYDYEKSNELEKLWVGDVSPLGGSIGSLPSSCYTCKVLAPLRDVPGFQYWRDTVVDGEKQSTLTTYHKRRDTCTVYFGTWRGLDNSVRFAVSRTGEQKDVSHRSQGK